MRGFIPISSVSLKKSSVLHSPGCHEVFMYACWENPQMGQKWSPEESAKCSRLHCNRSKQRGMCSAVTKIDGVYERVCVCLCVYSNLLYFIPQEGHLSTSLPQTKRMEGCSHTLLRLHQLTNGFIWLLSNRNYWLCAHEMRSWNEVFLGGCWMGFWTTCALLKKRFRVLVDLVICMLAVDYRRFGYSLARFHSHSADTLIERLA